MEVYGLEVRGIAVCAALKTVFVKYCIISEMEVREDGGV